MDTIKKTRKYLLQLIRNTKRIKVSTNNNTNIDNDIIAMCESGIEASIKENEEGQQYYRL